jgi:ligand-binding SRPBCC domain-containing protein
VPAADQLFQHSLAGDHHVRESVELPMHLTTDLWLPVSRERVFEFFARAENLQALTPAWLQFKILRPLPIEMREGTLIDYRIRVHGLPMRWRSSIATWNPPHEFVDTQLRGPYRRWVHTHSFADEDGGTRVRDSVDFEVPGGRLVSWFVARDLRKVFAFRHGELQRIFNQTPIGAVPRIDITR